MSYLVNSINIAPVAYGYCSHDGFSANLYNCTASNSANIYTINITSGTYPYIVPIASCEFSNCLVAISSKSSNQVVFRTHYSSGSNSDVRASFNFVIFGYT